MYSIISTKKKKKDKLIMTNHNLVKLQIRIKFVQQKKKQVNDDKSQKEKMCTKIRKKKLEKTKILSKQNKYQKSTFVSFFR